MTECSHQLSINCKYIDGWECWPSFLSPHPLEILAWAGWSPNATEFVPSYSATGISLLVSLEHLCDLSVLFMRIQNLVTIWEICASQKRRYKNDVTHMETSVCRHNYSVNNPLFLMCWIAFPTILWFWKKNSFNGSPLRWENTLPAGILLLITLTDVTPPDVSLHSPLTGTKAHRATIWNHKVKYQGQVEVNLLIPIATMHVKFSYFWLFRSHFHKVYCLFLVFKENLRNLLI